MLGEVIGKVKRRLECGKLKANEKEAHVFTVIAHKGKHSLNGQPKLKHAVYDYLT